MYILDKIEVLPINNSLLNVIDRLFLLLTDFIFLFKKFALLWYYQKISRLEFLVNLGQKKGETKFLSFFYKHLIFVKLWHSIC